MNIFSPRTRRLLTLSLAVLAGFAAAQALHGARASQTQHEQLKLALLQPNLPENARHLLEVFASMDAANVDLVAQAISDHITWLNDCEYLPFIEAWVGFDREAALDHALAWGNHNKTLRAVAEIIFQDTSAGRPQDALELMKLEIPGTKRGGDSQLLRSAYLRGLLVGGASVEEILTYMDGMNETEMRPVAARDAVKDVARFRGTESAMDLAGGIAGRFGSRVTDSALTAIVQTLAIHEPERVQLWLDAHPNAADAPGAKSELAMVWSESDPRAALEWSLTLGPAQRARAFSAALGRWIARDPEGATQWARQSLLEKNYELALPVLVRDLRFPLPHEAAFWASQIPDPKIQTRQLLGVLHPWWKNDPDAADRWVSTAQLSATVREEVDAAMGPN